MAAIFERQKTQFAGSFPSDRTVMTLTGPGAMAVPLGIVAQANVQFGQQVARIYDIGNGGAFANNGGAALNGKVPVFYVGGRTQGQASLQRVLGPQSGALCDFYQKLGNICAPVDLAFAFSAGCENGGDQTTYTLQSSLLTNVSIGTQAQDMIVNETIAIMFANMDCNASGGNSLSPAAAFAGRNVA
jgi:hypothetical protein